MTDTYTVAPSGKATIVKDPDAVLDYSIDLTEWLAAIDDEIASHEVTGMGVDIDSSSDDGNIITAFISGGNTSSGAVNSASFRWVTVGGRTDERTIYFRIRER